MVIPFFERPILNSPYECPTRHWELDAAGQPTQNIIETRRRAQFITPIPKPKKRKNAAKQEGFVFMDSAGLSTSAQQYDPTSIINEVRGYVDVWRALPNSSQWRVTPITERLLTHWRQHPFNDIRPFFCQVEAAETAIWLTEVAPKSQNGKRLLNQLAAANQDANPELMRVALKLATGAGKTTVMAMLIAWQTLNAVRSPASKQFTRGFLVCAPGLTIKDRLRVRAFGTQLLCEQVIGRALRRQSYALTDDGLFNVEYADVFGIPFDFTAKPVVAPVQPPRETVQVRAIRPARDPLEITFPRVAGYRVELPEERLTAHFNEDSVLVLNPEMIGPSITRNEGIIGESVDMTLQHLGHLRPATLAFQLTKQLLYTHWRDSGEAPKLHLFGQLKRITREWLDGYLQCKGDTYPALLMIQELADMACNKMTTAITRQFLGVRPIKVLLDSYNPTGSTRHVRFNTSKTSRWEASSQHCHLNWVVLDSDWEAEFCRVAESHPQVRAYVKNHGLGFEVPYRYGSIMRQYLPDFIVLVDDGHGPEDLLHLIVEIKGYRREDAKEKKATMETYWIPGVNHLGTYGRWAFAEFGDVFQMRDDFAKSVTSEFNRIVDGCLTERAAC